MELWDLYDREKHPLGRTIERGKTLGAEEYHLAVNVLSVNAEGRLLITKRHPAKSHGGLWEISGGSVLAGETARQGAVRELFEETGLRAKESELTYCGTLLRDPWHGIMEYYVYNGDFSAADIRLQESETVDFRLVTPAELKEMYKRGEFIDFIYDRVRVFNSDMIDPSLKEKE